MCASSAATGQRVIRGCDAGSSCHQVNKDTFCCTTYLEIFQLPGIFSPLLLPLTSHSLLLSDEAKKRIYFVRTSHR